MSKAAYVLPEQHLVQNHCEFLGGSGPLFLESEQRGDFPWRSQERHRQLTVIHALIRSHQLIEIQWQIVVCSVQYDPDRAAWNRIRAADIADNPRLHFHGVCASSLAEVTFLRRGCGYLFGTMKQRRRCPARQQG